ncbi:MAG: GNAT family N-acetyltransferase [Candidatus Levyibacteriota bacterium]
MEISFREYKDTDKQLLLNLQKEFGDFIKPLDPMHRVQQLPGFHERLVDEMLEQVSKYRGKIWFALDKEKVIGCIVGVIWEQSALNRLEIGEHVLGDVRFLYLRQSYRGQGIGTQLLKLMQAYFKDQGCDSMWVTVFAPNENAQKTYEKFGFVDREIGMLKNI